MPDQPTPKPLTWDEVDDALTAEYAYTDKTIRRLWVELLASRAESAALRESLAAAERQRDEHNAARQRQICTQQEWHAEQDRDIIDHLKGCGITTFGIDAQPLEDFFPKHGTAQCVASIVYSIQCDRDALAAELAEAGKVVDDAVPFIACHGAVERVKEHGNIESAENSEAILYRMLMLLGNHGAIERLGLKPAARDSAGKASGGGENANPE